MRSNLLKFLLKIYPPYLGTGIVVKSISPDFREIVVEMKLHWYNRNYVKTHFGGSLYAMTDPFFMVMLIQILGSDYVVWDKSARIDFVKPGVNTVTARFVVDDHHLENIWNNTREGQKHFQELMVQIEDAKGEVVARVTKLLYIRKKAPPTSVRSSGDIHYCTKV